MASNVIHVCAAVPDVFAVLTDPDSYGCWVVGSKEVRGADPSWPAPGSAFHHSVGIGPLATPDRTLVRAYQPPRRLVLEAAAWPAGSALVEITAEARDDGTRITLRERALHGPFARLPRLLADPAIYVRNAVALRRLKALVEERTAGS